MENGVTEGDRVVIIAENRPEWLIADLAIITCGAITVPAYTTYTSRDYLHILGNCQAKGIIVSNQRLMQKLLWRFLSVHLTMCDRLWAKNCQNKNNSCSYNYLRDCYEDVDSGVSCHICNESIEMTKDL